MTAISDGDDEVLGEMDHDTAARSADARTGGRPVPAPAHGYPRKRARTRRQLMVAGMTVLARSGPDGATVGEVARLARVAPGTFYNHFDDLEAMVDAVVDALAGSVEIALERLRDVEYDVAAQVAIGTRQLLDLARIDPPTAHAFTTLVATVPAFRTRVRAAVSAAITDGIEQGRFERRPELVTADAVLGAVVQWMRTTLVGDADVTPEREYLELVLRIAGVEATEVGPLVARLELRQAG